jgi:glycosyltransferase involved in cell wall biosynthesis
MASYGIRKKIHVIPNALDTTLFCPRPYAPLPDMKRGIRIVYVGRLAVDKNLHQLITMIRPVLDDDTSSVSLNIVGDGPEKYHLMKFVSSQGLAQKVHFTGLLRSHELVRAITNSDVCVSASLSDNQPMSLLESLACGVPVVAIGSGGVSEIIQNGYNGFLVDSSGDTSSQFVHYLKQLISDSSLRQLMSTHARTYVEQHNMKCLNMMLDAYHETIYNASKRKRVKAVLS